ncbi:slender lobes-like protein isoform X1 [Drosophila gunungcola]|uniref:slender lobes-like protein isoform X1 n=1 Tax=Drosophila gunungcola TaxID=103775 RepID=UPI0022E811B8|nr:slender lobes-like protein isoform X1 [Drosophila gunungcola]
MVISRSAAKLRENQVHTVSENKQITPSKSPVAKKNVRDFDTARHSVGEAVKLLEAQAGIEIKQTSSRKIRKKRKKSAPLSQPTVINKELPKKKRVKRKKRSKKPKPQNASNKDNKDKPVYRVRTSKGFLTISEESPPKVPFIKLIKIRSHIKQQTSATQDGGRRRI